MFHTFKHLQSFKLVSRVFWVSFIVFAILNTVENMIHYSIGRDNDRSSLAIKVQLPSMHDLARIVIVMVIFALLQAVLTCYFLRC